MSEERKGFNFYKSYFDVYIELKDKDKVKFMDALLKKQFWGIEPQNLDGMSKFAYISQRHNIDAQVKGYEDKTGKGLHPPYAPPTIPPAEGGETTPLIQEEEEGKGKEEEEGEGGFGNPPAFSFKKSLIDYGFEKQLVKDFLQNRKTKRLSNTKTAYDDFILEVEKTRRKKNEIFKIIVKKGWGSFKASWNYDDKPQNNSPHHNLAPNGDYGTL